MRAHDHDTDDLAHGQRPAQQEQMPPPQVKVCRGRVFSRAADICCSSSPLAHQAVGAGNRPRRGPKPAFRLSQAASTRYALAYSQASVNIDSSNRRTCHTQGVPDAVATLVPSAGVALLSVRLTRYSPGSGLLPSGERRGNSHWSVTGP